MLVKVPMSYIFLVQMHLEFSKHNIFHDVFFHHGSLVKVTEIDFAESESDFHYQEMTAKLHALYH